MPMATKIERTYNGRPYIETPEGRTTYTRTSTFAKALTDGDALSWWKMERVIEGVVKDGSILAPLYTAGEITHDMYKVAIARALTAGGAEESAKWGTMIHSITDFFDFTTERMDRETYLFPDGVWDVIDRYIELTKDMTMLASEQFVVCDELRCAGSFDRIIQWGEHKMVADIKTGKVRMPEHRIQTSVYAHSRHYDPVTGQRVSGLLDDVSKDYGLIIHLPRPDSEDKPSLIVVDIAKGWSQALLAKEVRDNRSTVIEKITL